MGVSEIDKLMKIWLQHQGFPSVKGRTILIIGYEKSYLRIPEYLMNNPTKWVGDAF